MNEATRPEDVLADGVDSALVNGVEVRKGSVGAFILNAKQLEDLDPDDPRRASVTAEIRRLVPGLRAVGVFDVFDLTSADVREAIAGA